MFAMSDTSRAQGSLERRKAPGRAGGKRQNKLTLNKLTLAALLAGLLLPALLSALAGLLLLLARLLRAATLLLAWPALVALLLLAGFLLGVLLVRVVHDRSCSYFSPRPRPIRASLGWVQITLSRVNFAPLLSDRAHSISALNH
jgi:hypothetical protein